MTRKQATLYVSTRPNTSTSENSDVRLKFVLNGTEVADSLVATGFSKVECEDIIHELEEGATIDSVLREARNGVFSVLHHKRRNA